MPKCKNKNSIVINPIKDNVMDCIFNDLLKYPVVEYDPTVHGGNWSNVSKKIGVRCKEVIDNGLMNPVSVSRTKYKNFITLPKNSMIIVESFGVNKKILFKPKIF